MPSRSWMPLASLQRPTGRGLRCRVDGPDRTGPGLIAARQDRPGMLRRRLSLLQAVSLNMSMMVGIGPFITIPTFLGDARRPARDARLGPRCARGPGRRPGLERAGRGVPRLGRDVPLLRRRLRRVRAPAGCSSSSSSGSSSSAARSRWPPGRSAWPSTSATSGPASKQTAWHWRRDPAVVGRSTGRSRPGQLLAMVVMAGDHGAGLSPDRGGGPAHGRALGRACSRRSPG